ncbi:hypothetical protein ACN267_21605 [Micromonospora sp. WMMD734]|uniref:hypothetical protein n=1 Tax=unclassified Micromonospora TaxID=2617518 RepID=UPI00249A3BFF|nr:hypothetical protein [Micromonospora sp. WMMD712]WFE59504.1 hypothetical protein O7633_22810 [Micromonospora sp. WMMD712]
MAALLGTLPAEVDFTTSGTTGPPVAWRRTRHQLVAEAELLAGLLPDGVRAVTTYAPDHHLYGYLLNRLVPQILGVPLRSASVIDPLSDPTSGLLVVAVPSAWWQIERSLPRFRHDPVTVVHSTAALPRRAGEVLTRLPGLRLCELHGSTETGLVGVRRAPDDDWTLAEDVTIADEDRHDGPRPLRVRSPRLARRAGTAQPDEHTLDDTVIVTGPRTYRLTGRRNRLVKVDGHRLDVSRVERELEDLVGVPVACRIFRDELRGEWYEILVPGGEHRRRHVLRAVSYLLPAAHRPRAVRSSHSSLQPARELGPC